MSFRLVLISVLPLLLLGGLVGWGGGPEIAVMGFHQVVIVAASLLTVGLGLLTLQAFFRRGRVADLGLGTGLAGFGAVYIWHGVFTGAVPPIRWLVYGPLSRIFFALCLLAVASNHRIGTLRRSAWALGSIVLVGFLGWASWRVAGAIGDWALRAGLSGVNSLRISLELTALAGSAVALLLVARRVEVGRVRSLVMLGVWFIVVQSLFFLVAGVWNVTWWVAHGFGALGTATLAVSVLVLSRSTHELVQKERHAEDDAARQAFLNNAAHALRTPLTSLVLNLKILQGSKLDAKNQHVVASAMRSVTRLRNLSDELMLAAVSGAGAQGLLMDRQEVDLADVAKAVLESFAEQASSAGVSLRVDAVPCRADVDAERISDLLFMLVENAVRFTTEGEVALSVVPRRRAVEIVVQDTGIGMTEEQLEQVFRPFGRPHEMAMMRTEGNGLSLIVARGIAEAHGGVLEAFSGGLGKGSRFRVRLPIRAT